jgi:hypothetical protein
MILLPFLGKLRYVCHGGFYSDDFSRVRQYFKPEPGKLPPLGRASVWGALRAEVDSFLREGFDAGSLQVSKPETNEI